MKKQLKEENEIKKGAYCCDEEEELLGLHDREQEEQLQSEGAIREVGTEERAFWRGKKDGDVDDDVEERMKGKGKILKKVRNFWYVLKKSTRRFKYFI